jgi:hypothetical protein
MHKSLTSENHKPLTPCSTQATSLFDLTPATAKAGTGELMACLTLVAPSGMTAEDRNAWVQVARATLSGIPADLLARGCAKARRTCKFASEIVPTILEEVEETWRWRKRRVAEDAAQKAPRLPEPEYVSAEEMGKLAKMLASGMKP